MHVAYTEKNKYKECINIFVATTFFFFLSNIQLYAAQSKFRGVNLEESNV